jgi:predicted methyltransferase MtxX (methanogen marker protein 4)
LPLAGSGSANPQRNLEYPVDLEAIDLNKSVKDKLRMLVNGGANFRRKLGKIAPVAICMGKFAYRPVSARQNFA